MAGSSNLNFNDPLYIHPSDTPGMLLVTDQLTGVENYSVWSRAMLIAFRAKNKISLIDGTLCRPEVGSITSTQWERVNALVLSWIMNTVSREIFSGIVYSTDAHVVWSDLKQQFNKVDGSRMFSIHREIGRLCQGTSTISAYFCKLKQLWDEFGSVVTLPSCECAAARKYIEHDQQQKLLQFLLGLNDSYLHVRSHILMMNPLPSIGQAFSIISQEESHRSLSAMESPVTSFYSTKSPGNNRADFKTKDTLFCDHCHWKGHTQDVCYRLHGYPPGHKWHKPQPKVNVKPHGKDFNKARKPLAEVNMVENTQPASVTSDCSISDSSQARVFSPAQYAEILKLLSTNHLKDSPEPVVNMAGPIDWEDTGDW